MFILEVVFFWFICFVFKPVSLAESYTSLIPSCFYPGVGISVSLKGHSMSASCFSLGRLEGGRIVEVSLNKSGRDGWKIGFHWVDDKMELLFHESYKWTTHFNELMSKYCSAKFILRKKYTTIQCCKNNHLFLLYQVNSYHLKELPLIPFIQSLSANYLSCYND